jgi:hypothetical protein
MEKPSWNFKQNWESNYTLLYLKLKGNANSRLNQMIIGWICIKIKSEDLIRLLMSEINLL